jgi:hypothetical protein
MLQQPGFQRGQQQEFFETRDAPGRSPSRPRGRAVGCKARREFPWRPPSVCKPRGGNGKGRLDQHQRQLPGKLGRSHLLAASSAIGGRSVEKKARHIRADLRPQFDQLRLRKRISGEFVCRPFKTVAALLLPPPRPAPQGFSFPNECARRIVCPCGFQRHGELSGRGLTHPGARWDPSRSGRRPCPHRDARLRPYRPAPVGRGGSAPHGSRRAFAEDAQPEIDFGGRMKGHRGQLCGPAAPACARCGPFPCGRNKSGANPKTCRGQYRAPARPAPRHPAPAGGSGPRNRSRRQAGGCKG